MNTLRPLIRQPPPGNGSAVARRSAGFDPWSGSVSPKQPSTSPVAIAGSHRCFCSSVPHRAIDPATRPRCTDMIERTLASPRLSSSMKRQYVSGSAPPPPYSSGMVMPTKPVCFRPSSASCGKRSSRSLRRASGVDDRGHPLAHRQLHRPLLVAESEVH